MTGKCETSCRSAAWGHMAGAHATPARWAEPRPEKCCIQPVAKILCTPQERAKARRSGIIGIQIACYCYVPSVCHKMLPYPLLRGCLDRRQPGWHYSQSCPPAHGGGWPLTFKLLHSPTQPKGSYSQGRRRVPLEPTQAPTHPLPLPAPSQADQLRAAKHSQGGVGCSLPLRVYTRASPSIKPQVTPKHSHP
jgi:hypothetical protein